MFRKRKKQNPENLPVEADSTTPKFVNEPIPNAFDLGWAYSENKDEFQMAKVSQKDRATHFYVIGATGTGKTKFLEFFVQQDILNGNGFGIIDPHGDLVEDIKGYMAAELSEKKISEDVVLIEPTDPNFTVTFNPLEKLPDVSVPEQVNELVSAFKKIWSDSWGVRMEDLMRNSMIALGEAGFTLCELPYFLSKRHFRGTVLKRVTHPITLEYFKRYDTMTDRAQITWIEPVMNKINAFFSDDRIRQMFSYPKSSFNLRNIMDSRKMLLINLDKGKLKGASDLLGSLLMAKIQVAAFSRSNIPQNRRIPFYLYIDEFQNFASESFSVILSEARKYGLSLIMAHQTLAQIPLELRSMILGNAGIQAYFRINRHDAQILAKEAFEYSGYEVKQTSLYGSKYWSLGEEWEKYIGELQALSERVCYIKHKVKGGIILIHTEKIVPDHEIMGMGEAEFRKFMRGLPFGRKYLAGRKQLSDFMEKRQNLILAEARKEETKEIPAKPALPEKKEPVEKLEEMKAEKPTEEFPQEEKSFIEFVSKNPGIFITQIYKGLGLSGYKGDKIKSALVEKGLIRQEETREGSGGRLAKGLFLTDKGTSELEKFRQPGKGGDIHRRMQAMLKEQAELFGWKGSVEKRIPRTLESVDLELKKDDIKVAVEISDTSRAEYEVSNIRKCLSAGYDYVISVCPEEKQLSRIKAEAKKGFSFRERERLRFCLPSGFNGLLSGISPSIDSEKGVDSGQITKQKELMGTESAAEFLGISRNTLYEWIVQRRVPHIKVGRLVKFKREDLEGWLKKREQKEEDLW